MRKLNLKMIKWHTYYIYQKYKYNHLMLFLLVRCEGSSIPLADEVLVRKRQEELKHAKVR